MKIRLMKATLLVSLVALAVYAATNTQVDNADPTNLADYEQIMGAGSDIGFQDDITALTLNQKFTAIKTKLDDLSANQLPATVKATFQRHYNTYYLEETYIMADNWFSVNSDLLTNKLDPTVSLGIGYFTINLGDQQYQGGIFLDNTAIGNPTEEQFYRFGGAPLDPGGDVTLQACVYTQSPYDSESYASWSFYSYVGASFQQALADVARIDAAEYAVIDDNSFAIFRSDYTDADSELCIDQDAYMAGYGYTNPGVLQQVIVTKPADTVKSLNILAGQNTTKSSCISNNGIWKIRETIAPTTNLNSYSEGCEVKGFNFGFYNGNGVDPSVTFQQTKDVVEGNQAIIDKYNAVIP